MAIDPKRDPYEAEGEAILDANPALRAKLEAKVRLAIAGKLETVDASVVDAELDALLGDLAEGD